jgi:hypothetical protein
MKGKNELGHRYGRLLVIEEIVEREPSNRCVRWLCECDCGRRTIASGYNLRRGFVKSCGCLLREKRR